MHEEGPVPRRPIRTRPPSDPTLAHGLLNSVSWTEAREPSGDSESSSCQGQFA